MTLGERIKSKRAELKLTLSAVSKLSGVSIATISNLETGWQCDPRPRTIDAICSALGIEEE